MKHDLILDLADCTEFRQSLLARPPRMVHGTAFLLVALLATALAWSAWTEADLIVRAPGRVRPVVTPLKVLSAVDSDALSATSGGKVIAVNFREGDEVRRGQVLVRLDTERLDIEIAKRQRSILADEEELAKTKRLQELAAQQFETARARARAELDQAREELNRARERQAGDVRLAEVEWRKAAHEEAQLRRLAAYGAAARDDLFRAAVAASQAREKLGQARIPLDEGKVEVLQRAREQVEKEYAVKRNELETKRGSKQRAIEIARMELANLRLQREQAALRAPIDGVVTRGDVKVGDILERGKPVLEIAEQEGFLFEATVPSEEVGHLQLGMPARIKLDAYNFQRYGTLSGTVRFLSPDSGVVEGQPAALYTVRIALDGDELVRGDLHGKARLGMAGQADIVTSQESLLALLVRRIRQTISLG